MLEGKREYEGLLVALLRVQVATAFGGVKGKIDLDDFNPFPPEREKIRIKPSEYFKGGN